MSDEQPPPSALQASLRLFTTVLFVAGIAVFYFGPSYQATMTDHGLVIAYPQWVLLFFAVVGVVAAISNLGGLIMQPQQDRGRKLLLGLGVPALLIYVLPGLFLTKITLGPKAFTIDDRRTWRSEITSIPYATLDKVFITREEDPAAKRNTMADFLRFEVGRQAMRVKDFGFLLPELVSELQKSGKQFGFTVEDRRPAG